VTDIPTIAQALAAVMADIGGVAKTDENRQQNYRFRGVDAVVNAVGPALRKHGVVMVPHAGIPVENSYTTKSGTVMTRVVLPVTFAFHGPAGDVIDCHVYGESSDAGDKVLSKAHSVAWRVAMLQVFAIPTDDPEPDEQSHERAAEPAVNWPALGWDDKDAHDGAWEECKAVARRLPEPHHTNVKEWVKSDGEGPPYSRAFLDEWADMMGDLTAPAEPTASRPVEDAADPTLLDDEGRPFE
jgi:hypothetical protein